MRLKTPRVKDWAKRHWPRLRLRTLVFATLFLVAALPGVGAVFLRVYENTLVRQTQAELVAQGAALAAAAAARWPDAPPGRAPVSRAESADPYGMESRQPEVDLSTTPIRPERPLPRPAPSPAADAASAAVWLGPVLSETQGTTLAAIALLDRLGRVAAGTSERGSYAHVPEVATALAGTPTTVLRRSGAYRQVYRFEWLSRAAAIRVHHTRPILVNGRVVGVLLLSRSARALFKGLYEDRGKIALGIAAIFAALVVLSGLLSRGVTIPIERLGLATRAVAAGRGTVPEVPATAAVEIQGLYADFATMAAAIERRSRYLRDIAYAISHEFKTPLAAIRGAVELLEDHPEMAEGDRHRFLANMHADADRLSQLVTRLLDLARADMTETAPGVATALATVIAQVADAHAIAVTTDLPPDLPQVAVPPASLETVLATLVENSRQAGATSVSITARAEDGAVLLRVADDGSGIAPADAARLFEPFFTTRRSAGGTGLGLTIARSLLHAADAKIALVESAAGTAFDLSLPPAQPDVTGQNEAT